METKSPENENVKNFKERFLLPFAVPVIAALVVALLGISFSRIFLAGAGGGHGEEAVEHATKSSAPVMWASIVTLIVLIGAALISLMKMRATSFRLIVAGVILAVVVAGTVLYSAGEEGDVGLLFGQPTPEEQAAADPNNIVSVDALPTLTFQATAFNAAAGVVRIDYIGKGGTHQLRFKDPRLSWFDIAVTDTSIGTANVTLEAGEYVIFCPIPGHEKMTATLTVK